MANYKKRDHYYIFCEGRSIEVSEPVFRIWNGGRNKEDSFQREYYSHTIVDGDRVYTKPSRIVSIYDEAISRSLGTLQYEPQECLERKMQHKLLFKILQELPENYKSVIYYVFFTDYSEVQASAVLGICQSSFHGRKDRALKWLRKYCATNEITAEDFDLLF